MMSSNTEAQDLEDLERYIKGVYLGVLRSDGSGITDAPATVFADYTMQRIQALLKRREATLKAEYEEKIREAYTRGEVIEMVGEEYDCTTCHRLIIPTREWMCENCDAIFHEGCEGYSYSGDGEYPSESAYALCKSCYTPKKELEQDE